MFTAGGGDEHHALREAVPGRGGYGTDRTGAGETRGSGRGRCSGRQRDRGHHPRGGTRVRKWDAQPDHYIMKVKEKLCRNAKKKKKLKF